MTSESGPGSIDEASLLRLRSRLPQMTEELAALTNIESPSSSLSALRGCAGYLEALGTSLLGFPPNRFEIDDRVHLLWQIGRKPRVLYVGHYDTVHQMETISRFPFTIDGRIARGPGVCDMKGGIITALHAMRELIDTYGVSRLDGLALFVNADEEIGSPTSNAIIKELAQTTEYAIGFENANGMHQVKTSRRGRSGYELRVTGKAVHAGERPGLGVNALGEMCKHFDAIASLTDYEAGTNVTPTMATAGTTMNTVPDTAVMTVDVRCWFGDEQKRVDTEIRKLSAVTPGAKVEVVGEINHPPLRPEASEKLFGIAHKVARNIGIADLTGGPVGGSADTCAFAGLGVQAIDGFGAAGGDDHTESEWIYLDSIPDHAALAAGLAAHLLFEDAPD